MTMRPEIQRVIFVPGLLEPAAAFLPLKQVLKKHSDRLDNFPDRLVFRKLDRSVDRLAQMLQDSEPDRSVAIVTHSFGDWVARQAIAKAHPNSVAALVSITPVMRRGLLPTLVYLMSGNVIPEIKVIMNHELAAQNVDCDANIRRLTIWARLDECLRPLSLGHLPNVQVERYLATHVTVVLQPSVLRRIEGFLFSQPGAGTAI